MLHVCVCYSMYVRIHACVCMLHVCVCMYIWQIFVWKQIRFPIITITSIITTITTVFLLLLCGRRRTFEEAAVLRNLPYVCMHVHACCMYSSNSSSNSSNNTSNSINSNNTSNGSNSSNNTSNSSNNTSNNVLVCLALLCGAVRGILSQVITPASD